MRPSPEDLTVHLIVDNYATHKHAKVRLWLAQRPRFQIHYTPTYSSWLNQVERWFGLITQQAIRRGSFRSVKDLVARIDHFVQHYNPKLSSLRMDRDCRFHPSINSQDFAHEFQGQHTSEQGPENIEFVECSANSIA